MADAPAFLPPADYPFLPTVEGEHIALRAIVRLHQREGVWTAILLDGGRHELEPETVRAILQQPFERAYVPAALFEPQQGMSAPQGLPQEMPTLARFVVPSRTSAHDGDAL